MSSVTPISNTDLNDLLDEIELPAVKYKHTPGENTVNIVYKNNTFKEQLPEINNNAFPIGDNNTPDVNSDVIDVTTDTERSDLPDDAIIIENLSEKGNKKYVCKQIELDDNKKVEVYDDITKQFQQEKYLNVLQRILRHNLRNDLNVILGHTAILLEELDTDTQPRASTETIHEKAQELVSIAEETQIIRSIINTNQELTNININNIAHDTITTKQQTHPDTDITFNANTDRDILGTHKCKNIIDSLLTNSITHVNGNVKVHVTTEYNDADDTVSLTIADNGQGIPPEEREILTEEKVITSLDHGSGLGLWVVRWVADKHGATIDYSTSKFNGAEITVTFQTP